VRERAETEARQGGGRRGDGERDTSGMAWVGSQPAIPGSGGAELVRDGVGGGVTRSGGAAVRQLLYSERNEVVV
jgi:hypothetical protein